MLVDTSSVQDQLEIRQILARYCHHCDDADFGALVSLFAADGEFVYGGRASRGSDELLAFFEKAQGRARQRGKHLTLNTVVDVVGDRATGLSDFLFIQLVDGVVTPAITGRYRDLLVRREGSWRIARREALPMDAPGSVPMRPGSVSGPG